MIAVVFMVLHVMVHVWAVSAVGVVLVGGQVWARRFRPQPYPRRHRKTHSTGKVYGVTT